MWVCRSRCGSAIRTPATKSGTPYDLARSWRCPCRAEIKCRIRGRCHVPARRQVPSARCLPGSMSRQPRPPQPPCGLPARARARPDVSGWRKLTWIIRAIRNIWWHIAPADVPRSPEFPRSFATRCGPRGGWCSWCA
jgi:hypothetical protein